MANMTLSIPNDIHEQMKEFSEIKWSEVARKSIIERLKTLQLANEIAKKSELTEKDSEFLAKSINRIATKKFLNENHR